MAAFFFILFVATINLALGYWLAAKLGYAPPSMLDAWTALTQNGPMPHPQTAPTKPARSASETD